MQNKTKPLLILMLIKWGALVVDGRGKLGGHVAAQNKGGAYLRTKVTPTNPQSTAQTSVRQIFGSLSQAWSGLTEAQIAAWNAAVDGWKETNIFGDLKQPSGKNLHQKLNLNLLTSGQAAISSPPIKGDMPQGVLTDVSIAITAGTITLTGASTTAGSVVKVFSSGVVSAGTSFVKNLMRQIHFDPADTYSPTDAYTAYVAKFGTPAVGEKIYVGIKYILPTGQASPLQTVEATIVA